MRAALVLHSSSRHRQELIICNLEKISWREAVCRVEDVGFAPSNELFANINGEGFRRTVATHDATKGPDAGCPDLEHRTATFARLARDCRDDRLNDPDSVNHDVALIRGLDAKPAFNDQTVIILRGCLRINGGLEFAEAAIREILGARGRREREQNEQAQSQRVPQSLEREILLPERHVVFELFQHQDRSTLPSKVRHLEAPSRPDTLDLDEVAVP